MPQSRLVRSGSVKDIYSLPEDTTKAVFVFSNRFSVLDYGVMPDELPGHGDARCITAAYIFEQLEAQGIHTHYVGVLDHHGDIVHTNGLEKPTNRMVVHNFGVLMPREITREGAFVGYDYADYAGHPENVMVPLELIWRNALPKGSSVFKRLKEGSLTREQLGLTEMPKPGARLDSPLYDVSTKYEKRGGDKYLTWEQAREIACLREAELTSVRGLLGVVGKAVTEIFLERGISVEDGKIEMAYGKMAANGQRRLIIADAVTLDEIRATYKGGEISKEVQRELYREEHPDWVKAIQEAKAARVPNIRAAVPTAPLLSDKTKSVLETIDWFVVNALLGRELYPSVEIEAKMNELETKRKH